MVGFSCSEVKIQSSSAQEEKGGTHTRACLVKKKVVLSEEPRLGGI